MAEKFETGGPAFPRPASVDTPNGTLPDGDDVIDDQEGMTLRDYFAAKALAALLREDRNPREPLLDFYADIAACSYMLADFMLKMRKCKTGGVSGEQGKGAGDETL